MKQLCYLLLSLTVFSNCLKITIRRPLMPGYTENYSHFAASFFSRPHNSNPNSIQTEERNQVKSGKINFNFSDLEKIESNLIDDRQNVISKHLKNSENVEKLLSEAKAKIDFEENSNLKFRKS